MKTDTYTKTVLTVIAVCLTVLVLQNFNLVPSATADTPPANGQKFGMVPLNENGSVDVRIIDAKTIPVHISNEQVPVSIQNSTLIPVSIYEAKTAVPVEISYIGRGVIMPIESR